MADITTILWEYLKSIFKHPPNQHVMPVGKTKLHKTHLLFNT